MQSFLQEPSWLTNVRKEANEKLLEFKLPQEREEEWRYTDLKKHGITGNNQEGSDSEVRMADSNQDGIIFTDLLSAITEHPELVKKYLGKAVKMTDHFSAMHYANLANGVFIFVPDHKKAEFSSKISGSCHTIIVTGRESKLEYTEEYLGDGFSTDAVEIFAGDDSQIEFLSLQKGDKTAKRFSFREARMQRNSVLNWYFGSKGAAFHRVKIGNVLQGEGARAEMICGAKGRNSEHIDFMVNVLHAVPNTYNNILAKGTLDDKSSYVFRGVIKIDKAAQKTDSFLEDHALLLSDEAMANNIPSLLIDANDVKCKHGATVGQVDEEQMFYLMTRGLSREQAEQIIVDGFFEPLASRIKNTGMREKFREALQ